MTDLTLLGNTALDVVIHAPGGVSMDLPAIIADAGGRNRLGKMAQRR